MHRLFHGCARELACDGAPDLVAREEARILENVEMLHDRRQRHREWLRQFADRHAVLLVEVRQKRAAGRIGEGAESPVERSVLILNHRVKYSGSDRARQAPLARRGFGGRVAL